MSFEDVRAFLMEEGSVMTRVMSSCYGVGLPVKFRLKQLASNTISRITITEKIDMHVLARCRVQKTQDALINCAQGHEGLVENTIPSAEERTKREVYEGLMADLWVEHRVEFYPLACGYNGAIAVDT